MINYCVIDVFGRDDKVLDTITLPAVYAADFVARLLSLGSVERCVVAKSEITTNLSDNGTKEK